MGAPLSSGKSRGGIVPNINVTPLVDVVLVLLIIFMVVLPNVQDGKTIDMVKVKSADKNTDDVEPLTVTIDANEVFTYGSDDLPKGQIVDQLRGEFGRDPRQPVLIRADAALKYKVVRDFFEQVQDVGFQTVSLAVGVAKEWEPGAGGGES